ncbi:uncharacterized protein RHO17_000535 isoform 1-T1 [Thomomys bottae]
MQTSRLHLILALTRSDDFEISLSEKKRKGRHPAIKEQLLVIFYWPSNQQTQLVSSCLVTFCWACCLSMESPRLLFVDTEVGKYKSLRPNCEEDEKVKDTLCSIFTIWMDFSPDDFYDRKNRDVLNELMFYVMLNMPSSDLLLRLHILLDQLEEPVTCQTKSKAGESLCRRLRAYLGLQNAVTPELMT